MPISFPEFKSRCEFFTSNGKLHGRVSVQLPDGRVLTVKTKQDEGIDLKSLTFKLAKQANGGTVGGLFGDAWSAVKDTASSVAKNSVTKTLYKGARKAVSAAHKVSQDPMFQQALSFVPGGNYAQLGFKAATLIERAAVHKDPAALAQISQVTQLAQQGNPAADQAYAILQAVYALGKQKNAWQPPPPSPAAYGYPPYPQPAPYCPPCYPGGARPPAYGHVGGAWENIRDRWSAIASPCLSTKLGILYNLGYQ